MATSQQHKTTTLIWKFGAGDDEDDVDWEIRGDDDDIDWEVRGRAQIAEYMRWLIPRLNDNDDEIRVINWSGVTYTTLADVVALCDAMTTHDSLLCLALNGVKLGDDGAAVIAKMLTKNKSIQRLELNNCGICDDGARSIADVIGDQHPLKRLSLYSNCLSTATRDYLRAAVARCSDRVPRYSLLMDD
jgi:Ran GTPase-activating protein (RanGAP) involved in mRNA processing and transport